MSKLYFFCGIRNYRIDTLWITFHWKNIHVRLQRPTTIKLRTSPIDKSTSAPTVAVFPLSHCGALQFVRRLTGACAFALLTYHLFQFELSLMSFRHIFCILITNGTDFYFKGFVFPNFFVMLLVE